MTAAEERFLSTEEVAERLQVDEQTVRRWIKSGKLEAFKPGREWRIPPNALDELLESYSSPKASASPGAGQPEGSEEERLLTRLIRRLIADMEEDASRWESTARTGGIGFAGYKELVARRLAVESSLGALDDVSETLGVNISDRRGSPLRSVRRDLQSAFNRWNAARTELIERHFNSLTGTELAERRAHREEEEERTKETAKRFDVG